MGRVVRRRGRCRRARTRARGIRRRCGDHRAAEVARRPKLAGNAQSTAVVAGAGLGQKWFAGRYHSSRCPRNRAAGRFARRRIARCIRNPSGHGQLAGRTHLAGDTGNARRSRPGRCHRSGTGWPLGARTLLSSRTSCTMGRGGRSQPGRHRTGCYRGNTGSDTRPEGRSVCVARRNTARSKNSNRRAASLPCLRFPVGTFRT